MCFADSSRKSGKNQTMGRRWLRRRPWNSTYFNEGCKYSCVLPVIHVFVMWLSYACETTDVAVWTRALGLRVLIQNLEKHCTEDNEFDLQAKVKTSKSQILCSFVLVYFDLKWWRMMWRVFKAIITNGIKIYFNHYELTCDMWKQIHLCPPYNVVTLKFKIKTVNRLLAK